LFFRTIKNTISVYEKNGSTLLFKKTFTPEGEIY